MWLAGLGFDYYRSPTFDGQDQGGGMLAALVARETPMLYAAIVGGLVLVGTVLNLFAIPHPTWFAVSAIVGIVATVLVTGRLAPLLIAERHK